MTTPEPEQPAPTWAEASAPPPYPGGAAYGPPAAEAVPAKRPVKVLDVVVTIVLLVADGVLAGLASVTGMFLVMASDPCGNVLCDGSLIAIGWMMGMILPWVAFAITAVVAVILMVKRRLAFWVPLAGAALIVLSLVLAFVVTAAGVPSSGA
ncbi:DUF6264 family protein [Microbacterium sp. NPDC056569]|uniref:DUF6264 family protein n=1 Tax=Microbacterium sp. NPDC056569 TaxID=3345867 RepID=UPI00366F54F3